MPAKEPQQRDLELENIIGNLMVAEYQVDRLRTRLLERFSGYGSTSNKKSSMHTFKHNNKWYRIAIRIDEAVAGDYE